MKSLWVICSGDFFVFLVLYFIAYYSHCGRDVLSSDQLLVFNLALLFFPSDKATISLSGVLSKNCKVVVLSAYFACVVMETVLPNSLQCL